MRAPGLRRPHIKETNRGERRERERQQPASEETQLLPPPKLPLAHPEPDRPYRRGKRMEETKTNLAPPTIYLPLHFRFALGFSQPFDSRIF